MALKIKDKYKGHFVAFGGKGKVMLGERSQSDLRDLAIMGLQAKDKTILELFDGELPPLTTLQAQRLDSKLEKVEAKIAPAVPKAAPKVDKPS